MELGNIMVVHRASSSTADKSTYEVFLSFGMDTGLYTDELYRCLNSRGIKTFMYNEELHVGKEIRSHPMKAIEESRISIPIFSKGYASSACLKELTQMVNCKKSDPGHTICPIFYDVSPTEVLSGAFLQHADKSDESIVQEWKDALKEVGQCTGWVKDKNEGGESKFIEKIVEEVLTKLKEINAAQMTTKWEPLKSRIQAPEWIHAELRNLKKEDEFTWNKPAIVSKIRKVPRLLLESVNDRSKYFEPKVLFLGPFHREPKGKYKESKQLKLKAARLFMDARTEGDVKKWKEAYEMIRENVNRFMKLYALETEESQNSSEENKISIEENNAWMFFLDGCAAMYFICGANDAAEYGIKTHELVFAQQDLLMLENQLPFEVLKSLMEYKFPDLAEEQSYMEQFIERHIPTLSMGNVVKKGHPSHLLHLMRTRLQEATSSKNLKFDTATAVTSLPYSCRSAVQLHKRGISFKASRPSRCKEQVDFDDRSLSGVLYLPSIIIDDLSKGKLLNLVADEMSSDVPNTSEIASYLCFLDSLIDDAADVKILRESNIIRNVLGSDEELAKLFNEITENLVPDNRIYKGIMAAIQSHFDNKTKTWMAQLYDDYFRTPWALISFSAAILLLSLSLTQTYLTLVPPASEERSQWKRLRNIVKHIYMPIVLALPMIVLLLIILLVPLVAIYMYGFPSKYKKQEKGQIQGEGKHEPGPSLHSDEYYIQVGSIPSSPSVPVELRSEGTPDLS